MYKKFAIPKINIGIVYSFYVTMGWRHTVCAGFNFSKKEFYFFLRVSHLVIRIGYNV